jgi:inosose dehydratase
MANAPTSWGIEPPRPAQDPRWQTVLEEMAGAGYEGTELGPLGFLPSTPEALSDALSTYGLSLAAAFVMTAYSDRDGHGSLDDTVRRTCELLRAGRARTLILIDALAEDRIATAGRTEAAPRLAEAPWAALVDGIRRAGEIARDEFGLRAAIHPHVGTHIEFEDEIERLLGAVDSECAGLCVDTGHSVYAGIDPVTLFHRHADRVAYVHFKDVDPHQLSSVRVDAKGFWDAVRGRIFCPLGEGCVDFSAVAWALEDVDYDGWATVEQDRFPDSSTTPLQEARQSLRYLRTVGLAG